MQMNQYGARSHTTATCNLYLPSSKTPFACKRSGSGTTWSREPEASNSPTPAVTSRLKGSPARARAGRQPGPGGGTDLSLAIRKRHAADRAVTRPFGRAVPGMGEQAWLLNGDRTLVVLAGPATVRLDLHGLPRSTRADVLIPLARLPTARLVAPPGQ